MSKASSQTMHRLALLAEVKMFSLLISVVLGLSSLFYFVVRLVVSEL